MKCKLCFAEINDLKNFIQNCSLEKLNDEEEWGSAGLIIISTNSEGYRDVADYFVDSCTVALTIGVNGHNDNYIVSCFAPELIWLLEYLKDRYDFYPVDDFYSFVKTYIESRTEPVDDAREMLLYIADRFEQWERNLISRRVLDRNNV